MEPIAIAIITAVGGVIVALIQTNKLTDVRASSSAEISKRERELTEERKKIQQLSETYSAQIKGIEKSFREPPPLAPGEYRNSVILLGIGNVGKTQFINTILDAPEANPDLKTKDYAIYKKRFEPGDLILGTSQSALSEKRITNIYISDYRGQNVGNLVGAFLFQQKIPNSPMLFGFVNSLIIIVDAMSIPTASNRKIEYSQHRVDEHLKQWSEAAIDAVFGLLTRDSLKFVCLLINKVDALRESDPEIDPRMLADTFEPIADLLRQRCPDDAHFMVVLGSAQTGENMPTILDKIVRGSVDSHHTQ